MLPVEHYSLVCSLAVFILSYHVPFSGVNAFGFGRGGGLLSSLIPQASAGLSSNIIPQASAGIVGNVLPQVSAGVVGNIVPQTAGLVNSYLPAAGIGTNVVQSVSPFGQQVVGGSSPIFGNLLRGFGSGSAGSAFSGLTTGLVSQGTNLVGGLSNGVVNRIGGFSNGLINQGTTLANGAVTQGVNLVGGLSNGVVNQGTNLLNSYGTNVVNRIGGFSSGLVNQGVGAVGGLSNGLVNQVGGLGTNVLNQGLVTQGTNVVSNGLVGNLGNGLVGNLGNGLVNQGASLLGSLSSNLGTNAVSGLSSGANIISTHADSDLVNSLGGIGALSRNPNVAHGTGLKVKPLGGHGGYTGPIRNRDEYIRGSGYRDGGFFGGRGYAGGRGNYNGGNFFGRGSGFGGRGDFVPNTDSYYRGGYRNARGAVTGGGNCCGRYANNFVPGFESMEFEDEVQKYHIPQVETTVVQPIIQAHTTTQAVQQQPRGKAAKFNRILSLLRRG